MSIKTLRRLRGWNQADLAEVVGIAQSTVSRAENLDDRVTLDVMKKIAEALRVPLADLFAEDDDRVRLVMRAFQQMTPEQQDMMVAMAERVAPSPAKQGRGKRQSQSQT